MLLLEPGHTPYDLHFRVLGIPVRVHPLFWLLNAIMGFNALNLPNGVARFTIWVACVFFSILLHEMGHVFMDRACGTNGKIVLYAFGGLAIPDRYLYNRWERIAVSFAGPFAQLFLFALLVTVLVLVDPENLEAVANRVRLIFGVVPVGRNFWISSNELVDEAIFDLLYINLFWALLNLLPIWPLDGGQISKDFLEGTVPGGQGTRVAYGLSLVLAAILAIHCIASANHRKFIPFLPEFGGILTALLFASLALQSWQLLQQERTPPWRRDDW